MTRPSYAELLDLNSTLMQQLTQLSTDPAYHVTTRAAVAFELRRQSESARYVVFLDIDHMHEANAEHGYEAVNGMIRRACHVRSADVLIRARWFSGDELVFVLSGNPDGFCQRLKTAFRNEGLGTTMSYTDYSGNLEYDVRICAGLVQLAKQNDNRGVILPAGGPNEKD